MAELTKEQLESMSQDDLDELVHDLKGEEAATINNQGKDAQIEYIRGVAPVMIIVVEGGLVRNVIISQEVPIALLVLDHDVQEITGHKLDGEDVNFYDETPVVNAEEVMRIVREAGPEQQIREEEEEE